jgi:hypothetical protein
MRTLRDVFKNWDSAADMANAVGVSHWAVAKWQQRKSIPSSAWPALIKALKGKGKDVGAADLLAMHTRSKSSPPVQHHNGSDAA